MGRTIGGIIAGIVAALATISLVGILSNLLHPLPAGLSMYDGAAVRAYFAMMPRFAQAFVALAWFLGALVGGLVAAAVSRRLRSLWAITAVVASLGILNVVKIPHPFLLQIAAVAAPLLGGLLASLIVRRRLSRAPADAA
jgi:hypothetical protein